MSPICNLTHCGASLDCFEPEAEAGTVGGESWLLGGFQCLLEGCAVGSEIFGRIERNGGVDGFQGVGVAGLGDVEAGQLDVGFVGGAGVCGGALEEEFGG